jgi:GAF domain-containing protein
MIKRFLRRLPVRHRILGGFLILVLLLVLSVPLIVANQTFLLGRLRQITDVEARADRLLLRASARVESSRVNMMRYILDYAPSAYEALDDIDQAIQLLTEAQDLLVAPEGKEAVTEVLAALADYETLITDVESVRSQGEGQPSSASIFQASRLGNSIGQRIEQIVDDSEARVAAANEAVYAEAQGRLILLGSVYIVLVFLALVLAFLIQRSITEPVDELRIAAESFREGNLDASVPVIGADELSLLARTFNEMAAQSRDLINTLEQRVADRTHDLEQLTLQLTTAADVGRAATSILELEALVPRVVDLVRERFVLYYAGLFLVDDAGEYAVLEAGTGEPGRLMKEQGHKLQIGGVSMVGAACAQKQARIALDVADVQAGAEMVRFDNPLLPETRSEMALPLLVGDRVLGALDVQSTKPNAFSEEDIAVLQLVADQVAVAVDNARKFSEEASLLEATSPLYRVSRRLAGATTTDEIVRTIVEAVAETEADRCAVGRVGYTAEGEPETFTFLGSWARHDRSSFPVGIPIAVNDSPIPLPMVTDFWVIDDVTQDTRLPEGPRQFMAQFSDRGYLNVPLRSGERVIGFVSVNRAAPGPWSPVSIRLYETLSEQAAVALERARLLEETQRRAARERLVDQITSQVQGSLDPDTILKTTVRELGRVLGARMTTVEITGPRGNGDDLPQASPGSEHEQSVEEE